MGMGMGFIPSLSLPPWRVLPCYLVGESGHVVLPSFWNGESRPRLSPLSSSENCLSNNTPERDKEDGQQGQSGKVDGKEVCFGREMGRRFFFST